MGFSRQNGLENGTARISSSETLVASHTWLFFFLVMTTYASHTYNKVLMGTGVFQNSFMRHCGLSGPDNGGNNFLDQNIYLQTVKSPLI